ncbi:MAG: S8 family serine peptidase [bacterium]
MKPKIKNNQSIRSFVVASIAIILIVNSLQPYRGTPLPPQTPPTNAPGSVKPLPSPTSPGDILSRLPVSSMKKLPPISFNQTKTQIQASTSVANQAESRPQYKYRAMYQSISALAASTVTNSTYLARIGASTGLARATALSSNPTPIIAVIDTGFAFNHEYLRDQWATNSGETGPATSEGVAPNCTSRGLALSKACNNIDDDGNGYIDDWRGWDFVQNDNDSSAGTTDPTNSSASHGTLTAGLAISLNRYARIMPLQGLDDAGTGYTDGVANAIRYATDNGASIISLSLGSPDDDTYLHQQITYAIAHGVLVVAAAGNEGCNCLSYPAQYPEVLAVGASTSADARASFSSYGTNLDVLAPGVNGDVCSSLYTQTNSTTLYSCSISGTSFSTPIVASLAALLRQQNPTLTPNDVIFAITRGADKLSSMGASYSTIYTGTGRVNVVKSVDLVTIQTPGGVTTNKHTISLSSTNVLTSPMMASTCSGMKGASCEIILTGPQQQSISLGVLSLADNTRGVYNATVSWNASTLGLTVGQWTIRATEIYQNQVMRSTSESLTVSN